jgi:hypothetical protein
MFDGERCLRCKNYFKFEELTVGPGGFSLCHNCAPKIDPNEPIRLCPADESKMKKELVENLVVIDRCESCGGIWFDSKEIEIMREIVKNRANDALARNMMWILFMGSI